jgi:hypothetical protein
VVALATCSYSEVRPGMGTPVRISQGSPRFQLKVPLRHTLIDLAPSKMLRAIPDGPEFEQEFIDGYLRQLDRIGTPAIHASFRSLAAFSKAGTDTNPLVLCCFENLSKGKTCHRSYFASWWTQETGQIVPELGAAAPPFMDGLLK